MSDQEFRLHAPDDMVRGAVLSDDGIHRYALYRTWEPMTRPLVFVMLNPSTADADTDDPTIRRCIAFARRQSFGGIRVVNLFTLRATDPRALADLTSPPRNGPHADHWISRLNGETVVVAWGATHADTPWHEGRVDDVVRLLPDSRLYALGTTKDGHPRHPLYLRNDAPLIEWGETWVDDGFLGGSVCAVCGMPTESEPCERHGLPRAP